MKVGAASGIASAAAPAPARTAHPVGAASFEAIAEQVVAGAAAGVGGSAAAAQVGSLEALIALQGLGGPLERRRRAVGRAGGILEALEGLKLNLLEGRLSKSAIESLTRAVGDQRILTEDPKLEALLDEIETRAAVELAKLEGAPIAT
jgi:hypothetical protein